jgi:histidyl-tRNA synthetase
MAKPQKLKARRPRGLEDRTPADIAATRAMTDKIREVYELYGFEPVETPAIEYTDALGKFLPDQDRPNEGVFSFQDDDEQWLSLRYDLTAPLARYVAENFDALPKPYRSYRFGWVFRNEKPGPGRFRQFMQFDADTVGSASPAADAEMCMMAADTMEALGIPRGQYVVRLNNRIFLESVIRAVARTEERDFVEPMVVMRSLDKLDRLGWEGVKLLLTKGRKDESGDFTKGNGLSDISAEILIGQLKIAKELNLQASDNFVPTPENADVRDFFDNLAKSFVGGIGELDLQNSEVRAHSLGLAYVLGKQVSGFNNAREILEIVRQCGYGADQIEFDPTCVRGLEYYTGPVYEVELLLETKDEKGRPVRFGSVGGGGRYDGLVSRFRGEPVPATGFSIGVSRLQAALALINKSEAKPEFGPVVVTVFDRDRIADYQKFVSQLRAAKIRAELYLGNPKNFGNQLKYADRRNAPCVVIQGGDEKAANAVTIKDLVLGAELATLDKDRGEYLQKQADAQKTVPEAELVAEVRNVLARHNVKWG